MSTTWTPSTKPNEADNCLATRGATVTVGRPDMVVSTLSAPPATGTRGSSFPVTDRTQNLGAVASDSSKTRYYLSLDTVRSASDTLLSQSRSVPALQPGDGHTKTVSVKIPSSTPLASYFVLACADDGGNVVETNEANNCAASATTVTVGP